MRALMGLVGILVGILVGMVVGIDRGRITQVVRAPRANHLSATVYPDEL